MATMSAQRFAANAPLIYRFFKDMQDLVFLMRAERECGVTRFRYELMNDAAFAHTPLREADYGKTIEEVYPGEFGAYLSERYVEALENGKVVEFETPAEIVGFAAVTTVMPLADDSGETTHLVAIVRDVTARKQAEAESRRRYRLQEALIQGTGDALLVADGEGRGIRCNDAFRDMFGWSEEEIVGRTPAEFGMIPDDQDVPAAEIIDALRGGKRYVGKELRRRRKDGAVIVVEATYSSVLDEQGDIVYLTGSYRDVTQRKAIERELEMSRQRYESLFFHHPDVVFTLDLEGRFLTANEAFLKTTGYREEELFHRPFLPMIDPEHIGETLARFYKAAMSAEPQVYRSAIVSKDGRRLAASIQNIPIVVDGEVVGIYGIAKDISREIERQDTLRRELEQLEAFWEHAPEAMFMVDAEGHFVKINRAFERTFGIQEDEVLGTEPKQSIYPAFAEEDRLRIGERLRRGETIVNHETKRVTRDGRMLDILASYTPMFDSEGNLKGATVYYRDITERKRAETELRQSEEKYRLIAENMSDLIALMTPDMRITYSSPSYMKVLGVSPAYYEENPAGGLVDEAYVPKMMEKLRELMERKETVELELLFKKRTVQGLPLFLETTATPILDEKGQVSQILIVSRDITQRKRFEEALKESELRFRVIAENTLDVIKLTDKNGIQTFASPSHRLVFGREPEAYVGRTIFADTHPDDLPRLQKAFVQLTFTKEAQAIELRKGTAGGEWLWMEATMTPVLDESGLVKHLVIVSRNITDRKRYEQQMTYLAYHDSLTGLPNRRLFSDRLEQALKLNRRNGETMALLMIDCDFFKRINDEMGHDVGDEVIVGFAERIQRCVRDSDTVSRSTVSRLGGDEFIVLLQGLREEDNAISVAERILEAIRRPWEIDGRTLRTTASIGIAVCPAMVECKAKDVLKQADVALYKAKDAGRNTYKIYKNS